MPIFVKMTDQVSDPHLSHLPEILEELMGSNIMHSNIDPIQQILPGLIPNDSSTRIIIMGGPPKSETRVSPDGQSIMHRMSSSNAAFLNSHGGPMMRHRMLPSLGGMFPMGDPMQAILSLLYGHSQRDMMRGGFERNLVPKARCVVGDSIVDEIMDFIESTREGSKGYLASKPEGIITIDEFADAAKEDRDIIKHALRDNEMETPVTGEDALAAVASQHRDERKEKSKKDAKKEATLKTLDTIREKFNLPEHGKLARLREASLVQTSLPKLAFVLGGFNQFPEVQGFINLLKHSMQEDGFLTLNYKEAQEALLGKLSDIFKNIEGDSPIDTDFLSELVYNTDIPSSEEEIMHIEGYPIDLEKLYGLSYSDAKKALTATLADLIFKDDKSKVDLDKFTKFVKQMLSEEKDRVEIEEVKDRIIDPMLLAFAPEDVGPQDPSKEDEGVSNKDKLEEYSSSDDSPVVKEGSLAEHVLLAFAPDDKLLRDAGLD